MHRQKQTGLYQYHSWQRLENWSFFTVLTFFGALLIGCDSNAFTDNKATLNLRIDAYMDDAKVHGVKDELINFKRDYRIKGRLLTLHSAHMYISEVTLLKADGTSQTFKDETSFTFEAKDAKGERVPHTVLEKVFLFRHSYGQDEHFLGLVEAGEYTGIRFKMGLEGLNNRIEAEQVSAAAHPLGSRGDFTTYWSPEKGYIFLRLDGRVDTNHDDALDATWAVHLGTSEFVHTLEFAHPFTLRTGESSEIHLDVNYAQFLAGLDYGNPSDLICYTTNNLPVARKVQAEIPKAFSLRGIHPVN